jgi:hypothetical protein
LSSDEGEEEESDGGRAPAERWIPLLLSPSAAEAAEEQAPAALRARRREVSRGGRAHYKGAGECHRGASERSGGSDRRRGSAPRTHEEEETGLPQFEVSGIFPGCP